MKKPFLWIGILLALGALLFVGWLSGYVGNVAIRRVQPVGVRVVLTMSQPVVPGVQATVHWTVPQTSAVDDVIFEARSTQDSFFIGQARLKDATASVVFPCTLTEDGAGLVMVDAKTEQVLGYEQVKVLPAGPDCLQ